MAGGSVAGAWPASAVAAIEPVTSVAAASARLRSGEIISCDLLKSERAGSDAAAGRRRRRTQGAGDRRAVRTHATLPGSGAARQGGRTAREAAGRMRARRSARGRGVHFVARVRLADRREQAPIEGRGDGRPSLRQHLRAGRAGQAESAVGWSPEGRDRPRFAGCVRNFAGVRSIVPVPVRLVRSCGSPTGSDRRRRRSRRISSRSIWSRSLKPCVCRRTGSRGERHTAFAPNIRSCPDPGSPRSSR